MKYMTLAITLSACASMTQTPESPKEPEELTADAPKPVEFPEGKAALDAAAAAWAKDFATPPPTIERAYLEEGDWGMNRNDHGVIIDRVVRAKLFYKGGASGRCYQTLCNLREEEQRGSWGKPALECFKEYTDRVTCSSVDQLRP